MDKNVKNIIVFFSVIIIVVLIVTVLLDFFNIRNIFPFDQLTNQYDWFGIIGAVIGGLVGAVGTYIGIELTIKNEREENKKRDIEERKRTGYSYLTLADYPVTLKIAMDSVSSGNLDQTQNVLVGKNVNIVGANYFDIELNFKNLNNNYPTAALLIDMEIDFDFKMENNKREYYKRILLNGYNEKYKRLTIKNNDVVSFESRALIDQKDFKNLKEYLLDSSLIGITTNVNFINANGVVTSGNFKANLLKYESKKIGSEKCLGSNKEKIDYEAKDTYLTVKNVGYCEYYGDEIFGGKNG